MMVSVRRDPPTSAGLATRVARPPPRPLPGVAPGAPWPAPGATAAPLQDMQSSHLVADANVDPLVAAMRRSRVSLASSRSRPEAGNLRPDGWGSGFLEFSFTLGDDLPLFQLSPTNTPGHFPTAKRDDRKKRCNASGYMPWQDGLCQGLGQAYCHQVQADFGPNWIRPG